MACRWPWHARDYWARFERFVKQLTQQCEDVYVLTGPLYLPQRTPQGYMMHHPMIGAPRRCFLQSFLLTPSRTCAVSMPG